MSEFAAALRSSEPVVGCWLAVGHPAVAEAVAGADLDFVVVDTEHAPSGLETVENVLRGVEAAPGETAALARVPWNDPVRIKRLLDTGPGGVVVPMVESAEEARAAVEATRYPPEGVRGIAASRASDYTRNFEAYVERANEDVLTVLQVETGTGAEHAAAIGAVDGVDALFVGPADMAASVGAFPDQRGDRAVEAVEQVVAGAEAAGVPVGTLAVDPGEVDFWLDLGMDFLVVGVDFAFLADGADEAAATFRDAVDW
jgi:2-keto-3-deoxy-L-rhamnonate aldolase RhmA